ncbi:MAG: hypothetical protein L0H93_15805, partial [Nocardioides sp.]|nr:hypothetical protein [Nocardioides sp.]
MRTGACSRRGEGSAALIALVVLLAGLTGCSFGKDPAPADTSSSSAVANEVRAVMQHRAKAVREGNMTGFMDSVQP